MDGISRDVGVTRPPIATSHGQLNNNEKQSGAETEQNEVRKEQRMVNELAQQKMSAQTTTTPPQAAVTEVQPAIAKSSASTSQQSNRAPNWSQLSAQVNGYTQLQRAMNLYQRINNLG